MRTVAVSPDPDEVDAALERRLASACTGRISGPDQPAAGDPARTWMIGRARRRASRQRWFALPGSGEPRPTRFRAPRRGRPGTLTSNRRPSASMPRSSRRWQASGSTGSACSAPVPGVRPQPQHQVRNRIGAPAAHACGEQAVGYGTGNGVARGGSRRTPRAAGGRTGARPSSMRPRDPVRVLAVAVAREPRDQQAVVVRPDRAGVVPDRVEAAVARGHRPHAPARVEARRDISWLGDRVDAVRSHDPAPQQVAHVGAVASRSGRLSRSRPSTK